MPRPGCDTDSQTFSNSLIIHGVTKTLKYDKTIIILIMNSRNDPRTCWTIQAIVSYLYVKFQVTSMTEKFISKTALHKHY